jgi:hypothetical protein
MGKLFKIPLFTFYTFCTLKQDLQRNMSPIPSNSIVSWTKQNIFHIDIPYIGFAIFFPLPHPRKRKQAYIFAHTVFRSVWSVFEMKYVISAIDYIIVWNFLRFPYSMWAELHFSANFLDTFAKAPLWLFRILAKCEMSTVKALVFFYSA